MNNLNIKKFKTYTFNINEHPYFLVTPSIIPFLTSISIFFFVTEIINFFYCLSKIFILILSFLTFSFILFEWFFIFLLKKFQLFKRKFYKIFFPIFNTGFLSDLDKENLLEIKKLILDIQILHIKQIEFLFLFINKSNNPKMVLLLWPAWLLIFFILNKPFTKFTLISITLFNTQVYNYFLIFPKEVYNKTIILNQIKNDYNKIINKIDFILTNKSANNDLISLDFLDDLLSIDSNRIDFIRGTVKILNYNTSFFANFDFKYLFTLNHQLAEKFLELSTIINLISELQ